MCAHSHPSSLALLLLAQDDILLGDDDADYDSADEYDDELFKGPADRAQLFQMDDLAREMLLADRHDKKQRRMEVLQIRAEAREEKERAEKNRRKGTGARPRRRRRRRTSR